MPKYQCESVLTGDGWKHEVTISVSESGQISAIQASGDQDTGAERVRGTVVPGIPNAHSHAFQRAMAGDAEFRVGAHESFWTWREAMYALANSIGPDELELIARQLFIEMLKAGYTSVAE